jgi:hypothetical protein
MIPAPIDPVKAPVEFAHGTVKVLPRRVTATLDAVKPDLGKLHLADFAITQDGQGLLLTITCARGQTVPAAFIPPGDTPGGASVSWSI